MTKYDILETICNCSKWNYWFSHAINASFRYFHVLDQHKVLCNLRCLALALRFSPKGGFDSPKMGQIQYFFTSEFSTEMKSEKFPDLSHFGRIEAPFGHIFLIIEFPHKKKLVNYFYNLSEKKLMMYLQNDIHVSIQIILGWFDPPTNLKYFFERILCHSSYSYYSNYCPTFKEILNKNTFWNGSFVYSSFTIFNMCINYI